MKQILFIILVMVILTSAYASDKTSLTLSLSGQYNDNVRKLSTDDLDKHDVGDPDFAWAQASDDLITKFQMKFRHDIRFKKFRIGPAFSTSYKMYTNNTDMNAYAFSTGINAKVYDLVIKLNYAFAPDSYTRKYSDIDADKKIQEFAWDKNSYALSLYYNATKKCQFIAKAQMADYFYNEYFTEYDGQKISYTAGYQHSFNKFSLRAMYTFGVFEQTDILTISKATAAGYARDMSYETDVYALSIKSEKLGNKKKMRISLALNLQLEKRLYTTNYNQLIDTIHSARIDKVSSIRFTPTAHFSKNIDISLVYSFDVRKTEAAKVNLSDIKDYTVNAVKLTIAKRFSF